MLIHRRLKVLRGRKLVPRGRKLLLRGRNLHCWVKRGLNTNLLLWGRGHVAVGRDALLGWRNVVWGRKVMRGR